LERSFGGVIFCGFNLGFGGVSAIGFKLSVSLSTSLTEIAPGTVVGLGCDSNDVDDINIR
jgi:hypothetical protein